MIGLVPVEELNRAGTLLLRPADELDLEAVRNNFTKITKVLCEVFEHHIGAFEFSPDGYLHAHLFVVARANIEEGFNKVAYKQFCGFKRWGRPSGMGEEEYRLELKEVQSEFAPNEHLQWIRTRLNKIVPKHGFKPVRVADLAPLLEKPAAIAHYIVAGLYIDPTRYKRYVKGRQMVIRPKNLPSPVMGPFSWVGGRSREWRRKNTILAGYLGLDATGFVAQFGRGWCDVLTTLRRRIEVINPRWPGYQAPGFDEARYFRRALWLQGLWNDDLGPEPEPYDEYFPALPEHEPR